MIQRDKGQMQITCDECGKEYPGVYDDDEFYAMINDAKGDGWTIKRDEDGEWTHFCCQASNALERARKLFGKT